METNKNTQQLKLRSNEFPCPLQLDYFDGLEGETMCWQMMECSCALLCLCLRCGREEEVSRLKGGTLLVWAAIWLQTARWHRYKQDLSSGLNSHILSLDSTQTLPRFYLEVRESSRSSVMTTLHYFFPYVRKKIEHLQSLGNGRSQQVVVNMDLESHEICLKICRPGECLCLPWVCCLDVDTEEQKQDAKERLL